MRTCKLIFGFLNMNYASNFRYVTFFSSFLSSSLYILSSIAYSSFFSPCRIPPPSLPLPPALLIVYRMHTTTYQHGSTSTQGTKLDKKIISIIQISNFKLPKFYYFFFDFIPIKQSLVRHTSATIMIIPCWWDGSVEKYSLPLLQISPFPLLENSTLAEKIRKILIINLGWQGQ